MYKRDADFGDLLIKIVRNGTVNQRKRFRTNIGSAEYCCAVEPANFGLDRICAVLKSRYAVLRNKAEYMESLIYAMLFCMSNV